MQTNIVRNEKRLLVNEECSEFTRSPKSWEEWQVGVVFVKRRKRWPVKGFVTEVDMSDQRSFSDTNISSSAVGR